MLDVGCGFGSALIAYNSILSKFVVLKFIMSVLNGQESVPLVQK